VKLLKSSIQNDLRLIKLFELYDRYYNYLREIWFLGDGGGVGILTLGLTVTIRHQVNVDNFIDIIL